MSARGRIAALSLALPLLLAGCAATDPPEHDASGGRGAHAHEETGTALAEGWAKAGEGMSGVFGTLENRGDQAVTLESVESPAAATVQLHRTASDGTMSEVDGGFVIPAGGSFALAPGGNHIMLMDLPKPLLAGDEVALTLHFDDGTAVDTTVLVKDYAGANEQYEGDEHDMDHGDMDMDEDHGSH